MNKEEITKKEIDYQTIIKTHLWTAFLATTGGTLALFFNLDNYTKVLFLLLGIYFSISFLRDYFNKTVLIRKLFNELEQNK